LGWPHKSKQFDHVIKWLCRCRFQTPGHEGGIGNQHIAAAKKACRFRNRDKARAAVRQGKGRARPAWGQCWEICDCECGLVRHHRDHAHRGWNRKG